MAWTLGDVIPRYVLPQLERIYDVLDELAGGAFCSEKFGAPVSLAIQIVLSVSLAYILTIWPVWCVLRYFAYTRGMEAGSTRMLYAVTGFVCCEYALGKMASASKYRGFFMSVLHYVFAMGAYVVFTMNPRPITQAYSWVMRLMNFSF